MSDSAAQAIPLPDHDVKADVEQAIALCDGDVRAALRATLIANAFLDAELASIRGMLSSGYGRGRVRPVPRRRPVKAG